MLLSVISKMMIDSHVEIGGSTVLYAGAVLTQIPLTGDLFDLAGRATVIGLLFVGVFFLNRMKDKSESKREESLKALIKETKTARDEIVTLHKERIESLEAQLAEANTQMSALVDKMYKCIEQNKAK